MEIYGFDFTSAPGKGKPITCAGCLLHEGVLSLEHADPFPSFEMFEAFIAQPGPWIAGMDFPFGQPRRLIETIGWPPSWEGYVRHLQGMSKPDFVQLLAEYRRGRPKGDKQHLRRVDRLARSRSPVMLYVVPVGKMFFEGAHRLLDSGASILPCHPADDSRVIVEAYPALVARRWTEGQPYKADEKQMQTPARHAAREKIINGLRAEARGHFGFDVRLPDEWAVPASEDPSGDQLDALLCAVQAAWAYSQIGNNFGIPPDCDPLEGWIVDPLLR